MSNSQLLEPNGAAPAAVPAADDLMAATGSGRVVTLHDGRRAWWRPDDAAWGATLAGRALTNLGVGSHDRILVALADSLHREAFLSGVELIGAQGAPDSAGMPDAWATVLVTEPFRAFEQARRPYARVILAHGPETGKAAMEWYQARLPHDTLVGELWLYPELPGPIALRCTAGRFHVTTDGLTAAFATEAPVTQVVVTREGMAGFQNGRLLSLDWVTPSSCECGSEGLTFGEVVDRGRPLVSRGRRMLRRDIIDTLFRVPGFGGFATVDLRYDLGLGRDYLQASAAALPGWDARKLAESVEYALSLRFDIPARAEGLEHASVIGVTAEDRRGGPQE
ncbi:MAG: hypothetical protein ACP5QO_01335 [Clostridia bacterium]